MGNHVASLPCLTYVSVSDISDVHKHSWLYNSATSSPSAVVISTRAVQCLSRRRHTISQPSAIACFLFQSSSSGIPCLSASYHHHLSQLLISW